MRGRSLLVEDCSYGIVGRQLDRAAVRPGGSNRRDGRAINRPTAECGAVSGRCQGDDSSDGVGRRADGASRPSPTRPAVKHVWRAGSRRGRYQPGLVRVGVQAFVVYSQGRQKCRRL